MKKLGIVAGVLAAIALGSGLLGVGDAGGAMQEQENSFTVNKVVVGPVPDGAVFDVLVTCQADDTNGNSPEGIPPVTIQFDDTGAPLGPNTVHVPPGTTCTAEETVTNGAAVTYACEVTLPTPGTPPEGVEVDCLDDQTVQFGHILNATGTITVTNTFEEPEPDVEPDVDVAPDVVDATPPFTG